MCGTSRRRRPRPACQSNPNRDTVSIQSSVNSIMGDRADLHESVGEHPPYHAYVFVYRDNIFDI